MSLIARHAVALRYTAALVLFSLAIAAWFHGVVFHPGSRIECCLGDGSSTIRDYWAAAALHSNPFTISFDPLNGAPQGTARAPATALANGGLQTAFVWGLRGVLGLVAAWNTFLLLGVLATALAMFALLDRLGCTFTASVFGAYVFAFSPYAFERAYAGHLALLQNWLFVLVVAALLRMRARRSASSAVLVGAAMGLAFYCSAYQGLLAATLAFVFFLVELARLPRGHERVRSLALAALAYGATVLALSPLLVLYAHERSVVGASSVNESADFYLFAAQMGAYFLPSPRNPLFHWLRGVHPSDLTEQTLFFGYSTLALALVAVVLLLRRNAWLSASPTRLWTAISATLLCPLAFFMSLPPNYHVGSYSIATGSALLAQFTSFWRVYSRFGLLVGFGLSILAALGLSALAQRRGSVWRLVAPAALALVALELLPGNLPTFSASARPSWVAWLAREPRGIVAGYPIAYVTPAGTGVSLEDVWYQQVDRDPLFQMSGERLDQFLGRDEAIRMVTADLADPLAASVLFTEHVRYVVVHDDAYRAAHEAPPRPDPKNFRLLRRFGEVRIYSVHAAETNIGSALRRRASEIAVLQGIGPPRVGYGTGFGRRVRVDGAAGRWLGVRGLLVVRNSSFATRVILEGRAYASRRPQILELANDHGRVLARQLVQPRRTTLELGPFMIPNAKSFTLTLRVVPAPGLPRSAGGRVRRLLLSEIRLTPVATFAAP